MGAIVNMTSRPGCLTSDRDSLNRKGKTLYYRVQEQMVSSYYEEKKTEDLGGWICIWRHTRLRSYGGCDAFAVGAPSAVLLVLASLVSTWSTSTPLVLDVEPLDSRGPRITVSLRFAGKREQASTMARRARARFVLERTGPGSQSHLRPGVQKHGWVVTAWKGGPASRCASAPGRQPSGNALRLRIAVWSRASRAVRVLSGESGREPEGRSQFPPPECG